MKPDAWVTIGFKGDTNEFDKKYEQLIKKAQDQEIKVNIQLENIENIKKKIEGLKNELSKYSEEDLKNTARFFELDLKSAELGGITGEEQKEYAQLEVNRDVWEQINKEIQKNTQLIEQEEGNLEIENQKLQELKGNYAEIQNQIQDAIRAKEEFARTKMIGDIKQQIANIGKSLKGVTKQVVHWGLAIFGVRSAYLFVRQAMSTISSYDKQLATDLQYIKFALAYTLEPLVKKIVEWAYKLLSIVGTIIRRLTGYNIFKNSGVDKFQKSMDKSAGSAKEIRKQLAGFDEMNVLQDNTSGGTGDDGTGLPSYTLDSNVKLPKWMEDLLGHGNELIAIILGIYGALKLLKLGIDPLMALGLGITITGIVYAILSLLDYLKDPSWENFGKIIQGIGLAVAGLGIAFFGLPVAIAGVAIAITGIIIEHWEKIKEFFMGIIDWLTEKAGDVRNKFGFFAGLIVEGIRDLVKSVVLMLDGIFTGMKGILDNVIGFFKNVFKGNWKEAWNNVVEIAKNSFNILISFLRGCSNIIWSIFKMAFGAIGDVISSVVKGAVNSVFKSLESKINFAIGMFNGVLSLVNKIPGVDIKKIGTISLPRLAKGGIINMPSKGVPVGSAIAGERGMEGVIPLTDSQQMSLLGEAIGKYITINAQMNNYMDGRLISRQMEKIQSQRDFVMNGR